MFNRNDVSIISSILFPSANNRANIDPAEAPEISSTWMSLCSIVFKWPSIAKMPIAPGPITKYFIDGHLIELRKLLSQKSEHERKNNGVSKSRRYTRLTRYQHTLRTGWQGKEHTWAQYHEQGGGDNEVGLGKNETHSLRDQGEDEEKHECVEKDGGAPSETITETDTGTIRAEQDTWAECEEECCWNSNLLGCDIWKHVYIISYYNSMALLSEYE